MLYITNNIHIKNENLITTTINFILFVIEHDLRIDLMGNQKYISKTYET